MLFQRGQVDDIAGQQRGELGGPERRQTPDTFESCVHLQLVRRNWVLPGEEPTQSGDDDHGFSSSAQRCVGKGPGVEVLPNHTGVPLPCRHDPSSRRMGGVSGVPVVSVSDGEPALPQREPSHARVPGAGTSTALSFRRWEQ